MSFIILNHEERAKTKRRIVELLRGHEELFRCWGVELLRRPYKLLRCWGVEMLSGLGGYWRRWEIILMVFRSYMSGKMLARLFFRCIT